MTWSSLGSEERGGRLKLGSRLAPIGPPLCTSPPSPRLHRRWLSLGARPRMDCTGGPLPALPVPGEPRPAPGLPLPPLPQAHHIQAFIPLSASKRHHGGSGVDRA